MTDKEILEKAIDKAHANGWYSKDFLGDIWVELSSVDKAKALFLFLKGAAYRLFIFDHDFAKALWGDELIDVFEGYFFDADGSEHTTNGNSR